MFREAKPENGKTGCQFAGRLLGYFDHWRELAKTERTYRALRDRVVSEQFLRGCDKKHAVFLKERDCKDLSDLAATADHYLEAQGLTHLARGREENAFVKSGTVPKEPTSAQGKPHCFICNKRGHKLSDCWSGATGSRSVNNVREKKPQSFPKNTKDRNEALCSSYERGQTTQGTTRRKQCQIATDIEDTRCDKIGLGAESPVGPIRRRARMPTAQCYLEGQPVTVLRDSGCDTVIVKRALVSAEKLTGKTRTVYLLDSSAQQLPEAEVDIDCPFYKGTVLVICMERHCMMLCWVISTASAPLSSCLEAKLR
ncbi:hypothetical protein HPB49_008488 [Dermacentor silvarum]|uniref:Uncharacterized protein n=1 Tax=Dermacentor silvarum TaxID=543639 RepID=A0ACB8DBL1_DERSI|nr:hypothetical protein HPB49_008488 [Dermacentor silvarum]